MSLARPQQESRWVSVPPEILKSIFRYLVPSEIPNVAVVCTFWAEVIRSHTNSLWKELWMENFGGPVDEKFKNKSYEMEKLLKERFPNHPRPDGSAADEAEAAQKLCFAARRGFLPMVRNLVAAYKGNTAVLNEWPSQPESRMPASPLFLAAQEGHIEIVRLLLQNGADVNSIDKASGVNALLIATQQKRLDIMKLLLEAGANPTRSEEGFNLSPLYISCQNGFLEGSKLLLDHGANLYFTYNNGVSCLFIAAQRNQVEVCKFLLERGMDPEQKRQDGMTPIQIAQRCNSNEVLKILQEAKEKASA